MFRIELAGHCFAVDNTYSYVEELCQNYITKKEPEDVISVSPEEIARENEDGGMWSAAYLESLAVYRKICERLLTDNILLFHCSAIELDGKAYLFTAPSGTGKSTHTALWRKVLGDRAVMINDDKPLIAFKDGIPTVYGTPWCGKHGLGKNIFAPVKAICILTRGEQNAIAKIPAPLAMPELFMQTYRFSDGERMKRVLATLDSLINSVGIYRLACNMNPDAALVAYEGMKG